MSFDPTRQPQKLDDYWLSEAIIAKLGRENLLVHNSTLYRFDSQWRRLEETEVQNLVRGEIASLNAIRAASNLSVVPMTANRIRSVVEMLKMPLAVFQHRFNLGVPDTLGCANGDLVLVDGIWQLMVPRKEDYRICRIPHAYEHDARAPRFDAFLDEVFAPDVDREEKREALLQMMGYALMTHCQHERFLIAVGFGANGKSVAFNVMRELAGPANTTAVHPDLLNNSHHRAQLDQKLVNITTESEQGGKLPAAELKALVSGEMMTVDRKFGHPFEMYPMATVLWATNHMPHPSDYSDAIFRRSLVLKFNRTFEPHERDPRLSMKLQEEMPGILNMALAAYARAVSNGFAEPSSSVEAKVEWRRQSDAVTLWLSECEMHPDATMNVTACYVAFQKWCISAGVRQVPSRKAFSQRVERAGLAKQRTSQGMVFVGIRVAAAAAVDC